MYNFGLLNGSVVVIDGGGAWTPAKDISSECRSILYQATVRRFFNKLKWSLPKDSPARSFCTKLQNIYNKHSTPRDALTALKAAVPSLESTNNAAQPVVIEPSASSHVRPRATAAIQLAERENNEELLNWLRKQFFWNHIAHYTMSSDGTVRWQEQIKCTPVDKLEMLLELTTEQRRKHLQTSAREHLETTTVFTKEDCDGVFGQWMHKEWQWLHPETLDKYRRYTHHKWRQTVRRAHRAFLHQVVGCYELAVFFLYVPFSFQNLQAFQDHWYSNTDWSGNTDSRKAREDAVAQVQERAFQDDWHSYGWKSDDWRSYSWRWHDWNYSSAE